jgi:hypothetical protein
VRRDEVDLRTNREMAEKRRAEHHVVPRGRPHGVLTQVGPGILSVSPVTLARDKVRIKTNFEAAQSLQLISSETISQIRARRLDVKLVKS